MSQPTNYVELGYVEKCQLVCWGLVIVVIVRCVNGWGDPRMLQPDDHPNKIIQVERL